MNGRISGNDWIAIFLVLGVLQSIEELVFGRLPCADEGRASASSGVMIDGFCHAVPQFIGRSFVLVLVPNWLVLEIFEAFGH